MEKLVTMIRLYLPEASHSAHKTQLEKVLHYLSDQLHVQGLSVSSGQREPGAPPAQRYGTVSDVLRGKLDPPNNHRVLRRIISDDEDKAKANRACAERPRCVLAGLSRRRRVTRWRCRSDCDEWFVGRSLTLVLFRPPCLVTRKRVKAPGEALRASLAPAEHPLSPVRRGVNSP